MPLKILALAALLVVSGCTTVIPPQSIELSTEIGIGIGQQHNAQISLLDLYFSMKQDQLNQAFRDALNAYFGVIASTGSITMNASMLNDVATDILNLNLKYAQSMEDLEGLRRESLSDLTENFTAMSHANASITSLLESAVDLDEARGEVYATLKETTGGALNLGGLFGRVDAFVSAAGNNIRGLPFNPQDLLPISSDPQGDDQ